MSYSSNLDWANWTYGLVAGMIGGGSTAVVSGVTVSLMDPKDYGVGSGKFLTLVATVFVTNAAMSMFLYLKQNPLPTVKIVKTVETVAHQENPATTVTTTIEQTTTAKASEDSKK